MDDMDKLVTDLDKWLEDIPSRDRCSLEMIPYIRERVRKYVDARDGSGPQRPAKEAKT